LLTQAPAKLNANPCANPLKRLAYVSRSRFIRSMGAELAARRDVEADADPSLLVSGPEALARIRTALG
jgi:hypothetical protein